MLCALKTRSTNSHFSADIDYTVYNVQFQMQLNFSVLHVTELYRTTSTNSRYSFTFFYSFISRIVAASRAMCSPSGFNRLTCV